MSGLITKGLRFAKEYLKAKAYYIYTSIYKKNNQLWLYGAWKGTTYSDNPKYFFEYMSTNQKHIKSVWITKNEEVYKKIKGKGFEVELYGTKQANKLIKQARYLIESEGSRDIGYYPVGGATVVQLGHGIPAKKSLWFKRNTNPIKEHIIHVVSDNHAKSLWLKPSQFYENDIKKLYNVPTRNFINVGLPRNDSIVEKCSISEIISAHNKYSKIVIYLPTHRNWGVDFDLDFIKGGLLKLEAYGKSKNIGFYYKAHPNEIELVKSMNLSLDYVTVLDGKKYEDVHQYIYEFDALISDYSGIIYDYLPINRPILLFDYDLDNYNKVDGGVTDEYFEYPVGPIAKNWDELIKLIDDSLFNDIWESKRLKAIKIFNPVVDGRNCERLYKELVSRIAGE